MRKTTSSNKGIMLVTEDTDTVILEFSLFLGKKGACILSLVRVDLMALWTEYGHFGAKGVYCVQLEILSGNHKTESNLLFRLWTQRKFKFSRVYRPFQHYKVI